MYVIFTLNAFFVKYVAMKMLEKTILRTLLHAKTSVLIIKQVRQTDLDLGPHEFNFTSHVPEMYIKCKDETFFIVFILSKLLYIIMHCNTLK